MPKITHESHLERTLRIYSDELPDAFAIVSWGCTATRWLAKVLNSHPEILALHHYPIHFSDIPNQHRPSEVELLESIRTLGIGYRLVGDLHGLPLSVVPALQSRLHDRFRACGLIREPLSRLRSLLSLLKRYQGNIQAWEGLEYIRSLPGFDRIAHLIRTDEQVMFVHGANLLNKIVDEVQQLPRIFRYEDVTTSTRALADLVGFLSNGSIQVTSEFVNAALAMRRTNEHGLLRVYDIRHQPWTTAVLDCIVSDQARLIYREFGYHDFLATTSRTGIRFAA